jgi:preprotein translocase subunit SecA
MLASSLEYRQLAAREPPPLLAKVDAWADAWVGWTRRWPSGLRGLRREADAIEKAAGTLRSAGAACFVERMESVREAFRRRGKLSVSTMREGAAVVAVLMERSMGLCPHTVQIIGALALSRGFLAEMATGEGKTLTVALWAALAAWQRLPTHVVTANDYLAERDAQTYQPFYEAAGVRVGWVVGSMDENLRRQHYQRDLVYTTSKELCADFLKDRLKLKDRGLPLHRLIDRFAGAGAANAELTQNGLHTAIVDEADNVLIDEAVTPLIISQPYRNQDLRDAYSAATDFVRNFQVGEDYTVDVSFREARLAPSGRRRLLALIPDLPPIWQHPQRARELAEQCLQAREFFVRGRDYLVDDGKVQIVDLFSGRLMPDRSWGQGMHQAVESKEGLDMTDPSRVLISLSFQRFFRMFRRLSGLSGTASEEAEEFWRVYRLPVLRIPLHKACRRTEHRDRLFIRADDKWKAVVDLVRKLHAGGKPILIGTQSVHDSELLAERLREAALPFHLLNATHSKLENEIIAKAGQARALTLATNMAGRGTDIRLAPEAAALGGLHVISTERSEARRIDRQLFGRAGRHGDPGVAYSFLSLDDAVPRFHMTAPWRRLLRGLYPFIPSFAIRSYRRAQLQAERSAFARRQLILEEDAKVHQALAFGGASPF